MSRARMALALVIGLLSGIAVPAYSGDESWNGQSDPWHNFWNDWHRNNCWMMPFPCPDRASVWNIFDIEVAKGWEMQNVLGEAHFENDGTALSPAGRAKMHWILTQNPSPFRTVFVARGWTDDITAKRLATAQVAESKMVAAGPAPGVYVSNTQPISTSADYAAGVNTWFSTYMIGMPKPQPEAFQQSSSGSSGSP